VSAGVPSIPCIEDRVTWRYATLDPIGVARDARSAIDKGVDGAGCRAVDGDATLGNSPGGPIADLSDVRSSRSACPLHAQKAASCDDPPCPRRFRGHVSAGLFIASPLPPSMLCPPPKDIRTADLRPGRPGAVRVKCVHSDALSTSYIIDLHYPVRAVRVKYNIMHMRARARVRAVTSNSDSYSSFYRKMHGRPGRDDLTC